MFFWKEKHRIATWSGFFEPGQRRLWWVCRWPVQYSREGAGCSMILGDSTRCVFFFDPSHRVKIGNTPDLEGCPVDMKMEVLHKQFLESYCSPVWSKNSSSPFLPEYRIMEVKNGRSSTSNYLSYTAFFYFHDSGRESNHGSNREVIAWCDIMSALLTRVASCPCWFLISSSSRLDWAWKIH